MIHERIYFRDTHETSYMTTYLLDNVASKAEEVADHPRKRPLVIVFPGGGYGFVSPREGEPIACAFNSAGFHAVVVEYVVNAPYPQSLIDASDAVVYVREHAKEWNVDPDKIFVCGFSAGAHLAADIAIMAQKEEQIKRADGMNLVSGMILCYPVISSGEFAHRGSFDNIGATDAALLEKTSLELQVDENTPPAFIWHTFADNAVPVENSLLLASAMRKHDRPFELHIYPEGQHGLSLANDQTAMDANGVVPHVQNWISLAQSWIRDMF